MRITIEIDERTMGDVLKITGETKKSPAVSKAIKEFVNRIRAKEFGRLLREGHFDFPYTNDEIEKMDG